MHREFVGPDESLATFLADVGLLESVLGASVIQEFLLGDESSAAVIAEEIGDAVVDVEVIFEATGGFEGFGTLWTRVVGDGMFGDVVDEGGFRCEDAITLGTGKSGSVFVVGLDVDFEILGEVEGSWA